MDTVAEPHLLEVLDKGQIVLVLLVACVIAVDVLEGRADHEVVLAVLVKEDITAVKGCLGEVVHQLFLLQ